MRLAFKIALRFLRSSLGQTIGIVLGIGVGVSVQVFIGSLITGLQASLLDKTIGSSSQITVQKTEAEEYIADYADYVSFIGGLENVEAVATTLDANSVLFTENRPVILRGTDLSKSDAIYRLSEKLVQGRLPEADFEVIVGESLLVEFGYELGDVLDIYNPPTGSGADEHTFVTIVGTFDFKVQQTNDTLIVTTLPTVRDVLNVGDVVSTIIMRLDQEFDSDLDAATIAAYVDDPSIEVVDWKSQNESLLSGLSGQTASSLMIQVFVTLSVVLAIASVLAITVLQKSKQVGILKAMGIKDRDASFIFLSEGMILGVFGAIVGLLLGLGLLFSFTTFALNPDGTPVVPILIDPGFMALSALIAFTSSSLASLIPAGKSKKISIIEVIKNG
ncbi:MAG: FtsX-like permease family protein [Candidatus Izemoplasmatales bacterium]